MRLGQLARKLALRPGEIVEFLTAQNIALPENSNTRLEDHHVLLIIQRFAPGWQEEIMNEPDVQEETGENAIAPAEEAPVAETPATETITIDTAPDERPEEQLPEADAMPGGPAEEKTGTIEVIKAPKVELPGLKVVGKIALPEPKKKGPEPETELSGEEAPAPGEKKPLRQDRRRGDDARRKPDRAKKNSVALQRERKAREAENRKRAEATREKEKRTRHYLKKVQPAVPTRPVRLIDEPVMEMNEAFEDTGHRPTLWGKFIRWLRRE